MRNVERIALKILNEVEKRGMMDKSLKEGALSIVDRKDRAFFKELVWGVLRKRRYLDFQIDRFLRRRKLPIPVRNILRMGMYELIFMDIPDYAVVNEIVDLVKVKNFRSLVNAILRRFLREGELKPKDPAVIYSVSDDLYDVLKESLDEEILKKTLEFLNERAKIFLRVNTMRMEVNEFVRRMEKKGWKLRICDFPRECVEVLKLGEWIGESEEFEEGLFYVQDRSSQLAPYLMDLKMGQRILDMCSGPGGKATHIAQFLNCQCEITTLDISKEKLELVKENSNRLRLNCLNFMNLDVREYSDDSKFDRILLDAPCTSIATGNKNPEVLLRLRRDDFERMARIQKDLLKKAVELLRDGGKILYSVCTVSKYETTNVIKEVMRDEGLESMNLSKVLNGFGVKNRWDGYGSLILPEDGYSPMYYAVLVKGQ